MLSDLQVDKIVSSIDWTPSAGQSFYADEFAEFNTEKAIRRIQAGSPILKTRPVPKYPLISLLADAFTHFEEVVLGIPEALIVSETWYSERIADIHALDRWHGNSALWGAQIYKDLELHKIAAERFPDEELFVLHGIAYEDKSKNNPRRVTQGYRVTWKNLG